MTDATRAREAATRTSRDVSDALRLRTGRPYSSEFGLEPARATRLVTPTALEADILGWLSKHCGDATIAAQACAAIVTKRDYTGVGYFVSLAVPDNVERRPTGDVTPISGPYIESPELPDGADTVVFLADGVIETLEIFSYGESFPERLKQYSLRSLVRGEHGG